MSDNGPHMPPPQPGGGGGPNQPSGPYDGYYGPPSGPQYGGQPPYGPDPYAGGQPPGGPQYPPPPDPAMMHAGGGGYGPGGYPPPPQPPQRSNLGLYVVIGGGAIIVVLVVVVLVMLLRGGEDPTEVAAPPPEPDTTTEEPDEPEPDDSKDEPIETEVGEPPHALPEDQCAGVEEDLLETLQADQSSTSSTDNNARCSWDIVLDTGDTAMLEVNYQLPYSASDSVEGAINLFDQELDWATDEDSDIIETTVHENNEIELGDQANLVFATQDSSLGDVSVATMLVRQDNLVINAEVRAYPDWINDEEEAPLSYSDVSDLMPEIGASAVNNLG